MFSKDSHFIGYACHQEVEELSTPLRLKMRSSEKHHLFDKSNHQTSHLFIACACNRHVEVHSTPRRFKISHLFIGYACDQQVEEISTPSTLKNMIF